MTRVVVRPRVQIAILFVLSVAWTCLGATYFTNGDVVANRDWFGVGLGCLLLVSGPLCLWRAARLGVVIDANGVRIRGFDTRDKVIPASAIRSVTVQQIELRQGSPLYAPVLDLGTDQRPIPVKPLGSYSPDDAENKAQLLRTLLGSALPS
jgi:hypothetical protein